MDRNEIDTLVTAAFPGGGRPRPPDTAASLRQLSAGVARRRSGADPAPPWAVQTTQARDGLEVLARSVISARTAAARIARLDQWLPSAPDRGEEDRALDGRIEGMRVFGCLLYLTGHPQSARFWWEIAGSAGDRLSAYCLYFQHRQRGETQSARVWFAHAARGEGRPAREVPAPSLPTMPGDLLQRCFDSATAADPGLLAEAGLAAEVRLAAEVDRLDVHDLPAAGADGIVNAPGLCLVDRLRELAQPS
ncbi:hypothetical protein GXW82_16030 [Streptacidiphilus sp. 4-A2]|nr:hypothetical protein [Streptacidiphilus sp. 4-A2]